MCYRQIPSQHAETTERSSRQQAPGNVERKERDEQLQEQRQDAMRRREERVEAVEAE